MRNFTQETSQCQFHNYDTPRPQQPLPGYEAARVAQAQRPHAGRAVDALHPARLRGCAVGLVPQHDRERQARSIGRRAALAVFGLSAGSALVSRRHAGSGASSVARAPRRSRRRAPRAGVPVLEGAAASSHSRAAIADRHDGTAIRASADPFPSIRVLSVRSTDAHQQEPPSKRNAG